MFEWLIYVMVAKSSSKRFASRTTQNIGMSCFSFCTDQPWNIDDPPSVGQEQLVVGAASIPNRINCQDTVQSCGSVAQGSALMNCIPFCWFQGKGRLQRVLIHLLFTIGSFSSTGKHVFLVGVSEPPHNPHRLSHVGNSGCTVIETTIELVRHTFVDPAVQTCVPESSCVCVCVCWYARVCTSVLSSVVTRRR